MNHRASALDQILAQQETGPVMRLSPLLGRPVMNGRGGARLGRIDQVVLDVDAGRLLGFRLRRGGLLDRRWRLAAFQDVVSYGPEGVTVVDAVALREDERGETCVSLGGSAVAVVSENGSLTGRLADAGVDEQTGVIGELVVTPRTGARRRVSPVVVPVGGALRCRDGVVVISDAPSAAEPVRAPLIVDQPA